MKIPRRDYGTILGKPNLSPSVPIIGLGCSSFSTFFWDPEESSSEDPSSWTADALDKHHPRVKQWIEAIVYAVTDCGINLLDTAPWYGHGTSEIVVGWAMDEMKGLRQDIIVNTKVGRYEQDPNKQFDFSRESTMLSVKKSLDRLRCEYIDVLQLHDPEFAPSLEQLMKETIPAMLECKAKGYCKALGMTGYPLEVQYQIMQKTEQEYGTNIWDQSLTYGHFNLHDTTLLNQPTPSHSSFGHYCQAKSIGLMAAAPLSMGLFTHNILPSWHPANQDLVTACREAATICKQNEANISSIAIAFALSDPRIKCTLVGMKDIEEVRQAASIANRFHNVDQSLPADDIIKLVLTDSENKAYQQLKSPVDGPFVKVWKDGSFNWDGIAAARDFWKNVKGASNIPLWQTDSF